MVSDQPDIAPDELLGGLPFDQLTGNRVVLDIGHGVFALYAHMEQNSMTVKVGEKVKKGEVIGRLGNSGNTLSPHLHFQLMRSSLPLTGDNVPWEIESFTLVGIARAAGVVSGPDSGPRSNELPLGNTVSNFATPARS